MSVKEPLRVQVEVTEFHVPPMAPHDAESSTIMLTARTTGTAPSITITPRDSKLTKKVAPRTDFLFEKYKIFATFRLTAVLKSEDF